MRYAIRLNPQAFNPLTQKVIVSRVWEIEQKADKDSEKVVWHCADVHINAEPIRNFFHAPKPGEPPWELHYKGYVARGQDNAIVIVGVPDDGEHN